MKRIIVFEFKKLFKSVPFYVILGICLIITLLNVSIVSIVQNIGYQVFDDTTKKYVTVYNDYQMLKNVSSGIISLISMISLLWLIFIAIFNSEDYRFDTIKTIKGRGFNNTNTYLAKYVVSLVAILLITAICILLYVVGLNLLIKNKAFEPNDNLGFEIIGIILMPFLIHAFYYFLTSLKHTIALGIVLGIAIPSVASLFLVIITAVLSANHVQNVPTLTNYLIDDLSSLLLSENKSERIQFFAFYIIYLVSLDAGSYFLSLRKNII
ncbi:MAG: hypothetical protein K6G28_03280 [Acholeplasmatales bacterium]|nr:hypothetical protein [Acholeplasmatales bacterium]